MKVKFFFLSLLCSFSAVAAPHFVPAKPSFKSQYVSNAADLCATAQETLAYLNRGEAYDPKVIHAGKVLPLPLQRIKETLVFICQHQNKLHDPAFIEKHFEFIRWYPDMEQCKPLQSKKTLLANLPNDKILMTKYYIHRAKASDKRTPQYPFPLYALPEDEADLTIDAANARKGLLRFQYGKQAILKGALHNKPVPVLAYLKRDDLEAALMQGTLVADFGGTTAQEKIFNVNRSNNIAYDNAKSPFAQERYWYFKQVDGIKGYGKDAEEKITVNSEVTFAADLEQFGLGKLLMVQYTDSAGKMITRIGVLADTGGAFQNNQYQVDFLAGSYAGKEAFYRATQHLPNYVAAYFMILKQ